MNSIHACSSIGIKTFSLATAMLAGPLLSCYGDWVFDNGPTFEDPQGGVHSFGSNEYFWWSADFDGGSSCSLNGSSATWTGSASAHAETQGLGPNVDGGVAVHGGVTSVAQGQTYGQLYAYWTPSSPNSAVPNAIDVHMTVSLSGSLEARADLFQITNAGPPDVIWGIAGAGASASGNPGVSGAPSGGVSTQGGLTNGLPNSGVGGGSQSSGAASITSNDLDCGYYYGSGGEGWRWDSRIQFSISYSGDYIIPNWNGSERIIASPSLHVFATGDINLETTETSFERVMISGVGDAAINGAITYTATDYNYSQEP